jgi:hypothetical protein
MNYKLLIQSDGTDFQGCIFHFSLFISYFDIWKQGELRAALQNDK